MRDVTQAGALTASLAELTNAFAGPWKPPVGLGEAVHPSEHRHNPARQERYPRFIGSLRLWARCGTWPALSTTRVQRRLPTGSLICGLPSTGRVQ